jgi:DivIVA domain-containing protein
MTTIHAPLISDPDKITPQLIRDDVVFDTSVSLRTIKHGYNEDQVDEFLDVVALRVENLLRENDQLRHGVVLDIRQKWADQWSDEIDRVLAARDGFVNKELAHYRTLVGQILRDLGHPRAQEFS